MENQRTRDARGLEHPDDPSPFVAKLFAAKLAVWTHQQPVETAIVTDNRDRLIAVYRSA